MVQVRGGLEQDISKQEYHELLLNICPYRRYQVFLLKAHFNQSVHLLFRLAAHSYWAMINLPVDSHLLLNQVDGLEEGPPRTGCARRRNR